MGRRKAKTVGIGTPSAALLVLAAIVASSSAAAMQGDDFSVASVRPLLNSANQNNSNWNTFQLASGTRWSATFDERTGVVHQALGKGLPLATRTDLASITAGAQIFIDQNARLLGATRAQLTLRAAKQFADGHTFLLYQQHMNGLPVIGGDVELELSGAKLVRFGSSAIPPTLGALAPFSVSASEATLEAQRALAMRSLTTTRVLSTEQAVTLRTGPIASAPSPVWVVIYETANPRGRYEITIDATDRAILEARNTILFSQSYQFRGEVEPRTVGDALVTVALPGISTTASEPADFDGRFDTSADSLSATLTGPYVNLNDAQSDRAQTVFDLGSGSRDLLWTANNAPLPQLDAWYYVHRAIGLGQALTPDLAWLYEPLTVNVNVQDSYGCNAFYDFESLNFYAASKACNNTARIFDIVAHEWGHGYHNALSIKGINAYDLSEGASDYWAATLTGDSHLGKGFTRDGGFVRDIEADKVFPDDIRGESHSDGLIWAGALWDLRTLMIAKFGSIAGVRTTDLLHAKTLRGGPTLETGHALILSADDDDADLSNGTPNSCEINTAFARHGLRLSDVPSSASVHIQHAAIDRVVAPYEPVTVRAELSSTPGCGGFDKNEVTLHYQQDDHATTQTLRMHAHDGAFWAAIPGQPGTSRITYWISVTALGEDGTETVIRFPSSAPTSKLSYAVGTRSVFAQWNFESDKEAWTHSAEINTADDWQIGPTAGLSGDPAFAFEGSGVAGTDLGMLGDGRHAAGMTRMQSPVADCSACRGTQLSFARWLSVERGAHAEIRVNGQLAWSNEGEEIADHQWTPMLLDISAVADGNPAVMIEFSLDSPNATDGGWTIDAVALTVPGEDKSAKSYTGELNGGGGWSCSLSALGSTLPSSRGPLGLLLALGVLLLAARRKP